MHVKRVISAIIFVPLFYLYVTYLPPEYFLFLLAIAAAAALGEFYSMAKIRGALKYAGIFCGVALLAAFFAGKDFFVVALLSSVLSLMTFRLFLKREPGASLSEISLTLLGLLYIPCLLTFQIGIRTFTRCPGGQAMTCWQLPPPHESAVQALPSSQR